MTNKRRVIAGLMIVFLIVVAVLYSNRTEANIQQYCWSPTSPGGSTAGLWHLGPGGEYEKVEDNSGWMQQAIWQVYMPEQNMCSAEVFPNGWHY